MMLIEGDPEMWGFIPSFLNKDSPATTIQQLNAGQPGGWHKFEGFKFDKDRKILTYPGDPPMKAISTMHFKDDIVLLFPHSWVLVLQPDGKFEVARCD